MAVQVRESHSAHVGVHSGCSVCGHAAHCAATAGGLVRSQSLFHLRIACYQTENLTYLQLNLQTVNPNAWSGHDSLPG